jgi:hypothetical protein
MNDPQLKARLQPYMQLADQVRSMPEAQYKQSRDKITAQLDEARQRERINAPVDNDESLDALSRTLAGPRAKPALETKLGKAAPASSAAPAAGTSTRR